jgi:hypothetical protein
MGWIEDLLKEVPLSAVLKERIALADQRYEGAMQQVDDLKKKVAALERENADFRAQIPQDKQTSLDKDTARSSSFQGQASRGTRCREHGQSVEHGSRCPGVPPGPPQRGRLGRNDGRQLSSRAHLLGTNT